MTRISQVWNAGWPLLLCAASAGVTFACVRMSDSNREKRMGKVTIEHIHEVRSEIYLRSGPRRRASGGK